MPRRRWSFWMTPLEHGFIRRLDDVHRGWLVPAGRALLWAGTGATALLLGGSTPPLLLFFGFVWSALGLAFIAGAAFRPRVRAVRRMPPPPSAGDVYAYRVEVENPGPGTVRNLHVEERGLPAEVRPVGEAAVIDVLGPGERATVTLHVRCASRGAYDLPRLQVSTAFPGGLVKWARAQPSAQRLLVYPRFTPLESFEVPHGRHYQPGGIAIASQVGESTEFLGTREWRHGDRVRDVHWPSFARTGKLIVKEYQEEYFVRLALVIDCEARTAQAELQLERALSAAASIADALARREYIIDVFAAGPQIHRFQAGRALAHFDHILELLAALEPADEFNLAGLQEALLPDASKLSAVILVLMDWDAERERLVQALKAAGLAVRVVCVHPTRRPQGLAPEEVAQL